MSAPQRARSKSPAGSSGSGGAATVASRPTSTPTTTATASSKPAKPTNDKNKQGQATQPSVFAARTESIRKLVRDSISEAKKVNWPDQETTRNLTIVVIAISVILGLLLGGIDYGLAQLLDVF